jgi:hypothetical protein
MRQAVDRRQVLASPKNERPKTYAYDGVFGPATEQTRIYEEIGTRLRRVPWGTVLHAGR